MAVIVTGFLFTLLTTAGSVMKVGSASSSSSRTSIDVVATEESDSNDQDEKKTSVSSPSPSPKVFSDELLKQLRLLAIVSGVVALEAASPVFPFTLKIQLPKLETPLVNILLGSTTLASFAFGSRMSARFKKVVHPLVTCTLLTWGIMGLFAKCVEGGSFTKMLTTYKMGNGINGPFGTGAGDIFLFLLGPAVLSLSVSMYEKRQLIRDNAKEVATATAVSTLGGLFGTALMVRLARILSPDSRVALISRNITSPLAMAISKILGADASTVSLAVGMVVVTGLIGANFGASILSLFGIGERNSVARGMGIGAAAHGLGTAAFAGEKDAFPFAAISMALTATACTVLVSIPVIKKLVLAIALGGV
jgi:putative effector of murein hydrolase